ncbi:hypothetical protein [Micromonospora inyonensis]|uniref:Uncharacterized protein n=1 Tax=Micromonospora inyonensis TaxID=47866 RepID=A0A1C6SR58_9ACTN|nr:hypothetical protein [Micromonospora inyonensis]SCL31987.1 hypothetical protein GA0074694_6135 [Micromonospora inyonensis]
MSTAYDTNTDGPDRADPPARSRPTGQPSQLPDWMRDPPPARLTLGDRVTARLLRVPGAPRLRHAWWMWRDRQRLHQRFPNSFKIVAFFVSWGLAVALLLAAYALFSLA